MFSSLSPGKGAERDRGVGRPEYGCSNFRAGTLQYRRQNCVPVQVGQFALVGSHSERGIALDELRRTEAFPCCQLNVFLGETNLLELAGVENSAREDVIDME